ncbi:uncharacterized protein LOC114365344 [Ostrinia furnacalis]|uniref:uncharacterized protein LOC114365344 n=1 Tax=Ostrinia furnacalis TaxID=93504 RepID=UPI00103FA6A5|nr:uncharacterized protein LOC114365344 [Ostrinia furnacalis]
MEQFIGTVKQYPILWNTESKDYHNLNKKEVAWKRVVKEINNPDIPDVKTAKNEWKKLRDSHRESLKRIKTDTSGQSAIPPKNHWKYADNLEFLLPHMRNRKRTLNLSVSYQKTLASTSTELTSHLPVTSTQNTLLGTSTERESMPGTSTQDTEVLEEFEQHESENDAVFVQQCGKRKANDAVEIKKNKDALNLFFDSMCESTKKLPDWIQRDVKKRLLQIVCEAEETNETYMTTEYRECNSSSASTPVPQNEDSIDNM